MEVENAWSKIKEKIREHILFSVHVSRKSCGFPDNGIEASLC
jgi:hypothetical protein